MNLRWRPPSLQNEDDNRIAARLHAILIAFTLVALGLTGVYLVFPVEQQAVSILITGTAAAVYLAALWILHRGRLRLAGGILLFHLFLVTTWIAINFDGVFDTSLIVYFLLIAITGLLLGATAAFLAALLSVVGVVTIYYVTVVAAGTVTPPMQDPTLRVAETAILLLLMGVVLRLTIKDLSDALQRVRREVAERKLAEAALARANHALEEARDELEERVDRRTAELAQANRDLQTLIQSSRDGILFLGPDMRLSVINVRALELLSLSGTVSDWKERPARTLVAEVAMTAPKLAEAMEREIDRLQQGGRLSAEGSFSISATFLQWYAVPVQMAEETMAHLIVLRDVTEQHQAEQMRNDLVRTMVHDLRNPLSSMLTTLETMQWLDKQKKAPLTASQHRFIERSLTSAQQMSHLIDNILDVSKLESGQMPLTQTAVSLDSLIADVVDAQLPLADEKQITLHYEVTSDLPPAWADAALLERVLQNLLDNAIKFTPPGGHIEVMGHLDGPSNGATSIRIQVADTGPGIAAEMRPKLFQKFIAGEEKNAGSGLGLAFCKLAVEAHGGKLWVESPDEWGSIFILTVPTVAAETVQTV